MDSTDLELMKDIVYNIYSLDGYLEELKKLKIKFLEKPDLLLNGLMSTDLTPLESINLRRYVWYNHNLLEYSRILDNIYTTVTYINRDLSSQGKVKINQEELLQYINQTANNYYKKVKWEVYIEILKQVMDLEYYEFVEFENMLRVK